MSKKKAAPEDYLQVDGDKIKSTTGNIGGYVNRYGQVVIHMTILLK